MLTDPIADLLTRIRNAQHGRRPQCKLPWSKIKQGMCEMFHKHGYFETVEVVGEGYRRELVLTFVPEKPFLSINRISTPGGRMYVGAADLRKVYEGLSAKFSMERKDTEISALLSALSAMIMSIAAMLSLLWVYRRS